jgi:DNA polymerase-3 subunit beta
MATSEYSSSFTAQSHDIARLFNLTKMAMSTDETRYYLNGVYLHPSMDGYIVAVATDGHRLAKATLHHGAAFPGVIVPRKTVVELVKVLDIGDVEVSVSETKIMFDMGATKIVSKVVDGTFPAYARVIPTGNANVVTAAASDVKAAADRVATVSDAQTRAVKIAVDGNLAVFSTQGNSGTAQEEVEVSYIGPAITVGLNAKYLAETLAQCGGQSVTIACGGAESPVLITPSEDGVVYVVMPMRVL